MTRDARSHELRLDWRTVEPERLAWAKAVEARAPRVPGGNVPVGAKFPTERDWVQRLSYAGRIQLLAHTMPHKPLALSERFAGRSDGGLYGDVIERIDGSTGEILKTDEPHETVRGGSAPKQPPRRFPRMTPEHSHHEPRPHSKRRLLRAAHGTNGMRFGVSDRGGSAGPNHCFCIAFQKSSNSITFRLAEPCYGRRCP